MSEVLKTVRIVSLEAGHAEGFVEINESDFDASKHELFEGEVLSKSFEEAAAKLEDAKEEVAKEEAELAEAKVEEAKAEVVAEEAWGKTKK